MYWAFIFIKVFRVGKKRHSFVLTWGMSKAKEVCFKYVTEYYNKSKITPTLIEMCPKAITKSNSNIITSKITSTLKGKRLPDPIQRRSRCCSWRPRGCRCGSAGSRRQVREESNIRGTKIRPKFLDEKIFPDFSFQDEPVKEKKNNGIVNGHDNAVAE